jgi:hypothetical protein
MRAIVTAEEMWRAVGGYLASQRRERRLSASAVERKGGPNYKTVTAIDRGEIGQVDKLEQYVQALGLVLPDVLRVVLATDVAPLSPEASFLLRTFERTTTRGRTALLDVARVVPIQPAESQPKPSR